MPERFRTTSRLSLNRPGARPTARGPAAVSVRPCTLALAALLLTPAAVAQSAIPSTAPTSITPSQLPSANPPVTAPTPSAGGSDLHWDGHLLQISASGEDLNTLLQHVAERTGMRLAGSAPQERIFGSYGPGPLADLVAQLTEGLPLNVLFVDRIGNRPAELTLTARNGAATPPTAYPQEAVSRPAPPQQIFPQQQPQGNPGPGATAASGGIPGIPTGSTGGSDSANSASQPQSPNGVKTPQEIFEQLQRLRSAAANR